MENKASAGETAAIREDRYDFEDEYRRLKETTWLKNPFYTEFVSHPMDIARKNIPDFLDAAAAAYPQKTALIFEGRHISYQSLKTYVDRLANSLQTLGIGKGDRVGLCVPNIPQGVIAYFAIIKLGAIMIAENPLFSSAEFNIFFNQSGATCLIVLDRVFETKVKAILNETPLKTVITTLAEDFSVSGRCPPKNRKKTETPGKIQVRDFMELLESHKADPIKTVLDWEDPISCFHTSGTMGRPKSVMHSNRALSSLAQQITALFAERNAAEEVFASVVPIFHSFGAQILLTAISMAATIHLIPKPSGEAVLDSIQTVKPTIVPLTPPILNEILYHPDLMRTDISLVKDFFCGSAHLPVELFHAYKAMGVEICAGYGMLESIMSIANPRGPKGRKKPESIGIPTPNVDAVIVGNDGKICRPVPVDATGKARLPENPKERDSFVGELRIRSPHQMLFYDQDEKRTGAALDDFGFIRSGDIGYMDEDGYFYILGRESDAFTCGTSDVFPDEVEDRLIRHPMVKDVCVIDIPHEIYGSAPKAYILTVKGQTLDYLELKKFLEDKLAGWKIPVEFEFVASLPVSSGGKKLRRILREEDRQKRRGKKSIAIITDKNV